VARHHKTQSAPVDTLDLSPAQQLALAGNPLVQAFHRELLARLHASHVGASIVLAMGRGARQIAPSVAPAGVEVIGLDSYAEPGFQASCQAALTQLAGRTYSKDVASPTFTAPAARSQLPRMDLPYGTPRWSGTSGDRAVRPIDTDTGRPSPDYLKVFVPQWLADLDPAPLSAPEQRASEELR
jgi:hypothetical protein